MSGPSTPNAVPIESKAQLVEDLEIGCKPPEEWRIGTEHEKFAFRWSDYRPLPYDGPDGIRAILEGLMPYGWEGVYEGETLIGLKKGGASVSLEPGGQIELSGALVKNIHQTCAEVHSHLSEIKTVNQRLGVGLLGLGFHPKWRREDMPWMPKGRYKIMREYMPKRGSLGLDMMLRTCTVQTNLDFASEADMVRKFRVSLALQPIATALFANSPFTEGKPNDFVSYRSHIWTDTDPDRCGMLPFVFEDGMGFERYIDYLLDVPMYFVYRDGQYIDASGQSFRDFLDGKLPALPGEKPMMGDWADHMTTVFPEVRLKRFLEMRGADGGPWRSLCALPALWVGLLYNQDSLDEAWALVKDWTAEEHQALRDGVPRHGFSTPFRDITVRDLSCEILAIARKGLRRRAELDLVGHNEEGFLATLQENCDQAKTPAEYLLEDFHERWNSDIDRIFIECAY